MIDSEMLNLAAKYSKERFTPEELTELDGIVDHDILVTIDRRQGTQTFDYDDDEPFEEPLAEKGPGKLFSALAFFSLMGDGKNKEPRFRIGDHVQVRWRGQEGTIIDKNGSLYMVSMNDGRIVESYKESQLEKPW